ncbi:adrenodoxin, mitochondrial [Panthera pardus]|uniref:Adrenal ferredoxin n=1 Tax=Panthera pardus TaxID=9691 RepID=A0A9W2VDR0_PANPR|nr:adrenodoxin, mitochondrial [Panthera leo]XP_042813475.1 adrenodoxin, mitochondrial [Panthera tigris]XP_053756503.1 adrenodoxin, mitochondrial [Panthera pardus]XP_060460613.1 adrenodoxin, mitochondrial isoform X1 [Panthera onca]
MAAAGGARLLRAASVALGGAAYRWLLHAGPRAGAGCLAGLGGPGGPGGPGRGGGAVAPRTLSVSAPARSSSEDKITVHFVNRDGETLTAKGKVGDSLLDVVVENNLDIDGFGACEGTLACSTCHLIFEDHIFEKLDAVTDEENDMLDLAYGLTDRSRLGCQICLTKSMDNMTVRVPDVVADARQSIDVGKNS